MTILSDFRSFRTTASGRLRVSVRAENDWGWFEDIAHAEVADAVAAGSRLSATLEATLETELTGSRPIELRLEESAGEDWRRQDWVRMEHPADPTEPFDLGDLDYLKDTDGDGVGDINEKLAGTDPNDATSTPGRSVIDVMALYARGFATAHEDPTARIQHVFALANAFFDNTGLNLRLRLVGTVPVDLGAGEALGARVEPATLQREGERHGADLNVLFRGQPPNAGACGWAYLGARGARGHFDSRLVEDQLRDDHAHVVGNCSGRTLAHELGHTMGLAHSVWQNEAGTWRWSRGHAVEDDFYTTMSYGRGGVSVEMFSSPDATCRGEMETDKACGVAKEEVEGADAAASLEAVRFQIAGHRKAFRDRDRDGFVDPVDDLPTDSTEWWDTDGDGVGNNADTDDDGDGVVDGTDAFPLNASETRDRDGDGVGDNADAFPRDATETADADKDGVGDNADSFPNDPDETTDSDGDGVGDNGDPFPNDPGESADTDGDGIGDNADPDADGDGVADTLDLFPLDAEKSDASSYWFVGEHVQDGTGEAVAANADGTAFLIGAPEQEVNGEAEVGAVYLVASPDLPSIDAADGMLDRMVRVAHVPEAPDSWKFVGEGRWHGAGESVAVGDIDGDGVTDAMIGAISYHCTDSRWWCGAAYLVSGADFEAADAADGTSDHTIALANIAEQPNSWQFVGEATADGLGWDIAVLGDMDDDGRKDIAVGAPSRYWHEAPGAGSIYVLASGGFAAGDRADGTEDGVVDLRQLAALKGSWKIVGESAGDMAGQALAAVPDMDGDGDPELLIGAPHRDTDAALNGGAAYLVSSAGLAAADRADGSRDRVVALAHAVGVRGSWRLAGPEHARVGRAVAAAVDGDETRLLAGEYLIDSSRLPAADEGDGSKDGSVDLEAAVGAGLAHKLPGRGNFIRVADAGLALAVADRWRYEQGMPRWAGMGYVIPVAAVAPASGDDSVLSSSELAGVGWTIAGSSTFGRFGEPLAPAGDVDVDGLGDVLFGSGRHSQATEPGSAYLLLAGDLPALDRADGAVDMLVHLGNIAGDTDADDLGNSIDLDDDGDGVPDSFDVFPLDALDFADSDMDGFGDRSDAFPFNRDEWLDTDADGIGDNADEDDDGDGVLDREDPRPRDTDDDGLTNRLDPDDDNDGTPDAEDACPVDATETLDTDGDGTCDNADRDDDNDGTPDWRDAFPLDPTESSDQDEDGTGDNADAFPEDPDEQTDTDGDGIGNNADTDDDNDGVPDSRDAFPLDATAKRDRDGDGVSDREDAFPLDAAESVDTDGDGVGNNADRDDDGDGVPDAKDRFPLDATRTSLGSIRFVGEGPEDRLGESASVVGDLDGDGRSDFAVGAAGHGAWGAVYAMAASRLASADGADGIRDGVVNASHIASQTDSWKLLGEDGFRAGSALSPLRALGRDGSPDFGVGATAIVGSWYAIAAAALATTDALDGTADGQLALGSIAGQPDSWKLLGSWGGCMGCRGTMARVAEATHLLFAMPGAGYGHSPGQAYLLEVGALGSMDGTDGNADGFIDFRRHDGNFVGENPMDGAGTSLAAADFDGDGASDVVIGAPKHALTFADEGAVYVIGSRDLASRMTLATVAARRFSWKLVGGAIAAGAGKTIAVGDVDGDGQVDLIVGKSGGVRVLSGTTDNFVRFDRADGDRDGVIDIGASNTRTRGWSAVPKEGWTPGSLATVDVDGDGRADVLMGKDQSHRPEGLVAELFLGADFAAQGTEDVSSSYQFRIHGSAHDWGHVTVATAGDVDADGLEDFLIGLPTYNEAYLINAADLDLLDANDGIKDGLIHLSTVAGEERP